MAVARLMAVLACVGVCLMSQTSGRQTAGDLPHIVFIVADDLGEWAQQVRIDAEVGRGE